MAHKRTQERLKAVSANIYWDLTGNYPLAYRRGELVTRVHLAPPGDAYPVVGYFYKHINDVVKRYFLAAGSSLEGVIPARKIVVANKVPYPDFGVEVVMDAQIIGHVVFNIEDRAWRFRPLYATVSRMIEQEKGFYAKTNLEKLARGYVVKPSQVTASNLPREDEYIALASSDYNYLGVGVLLKNKRIYVLKSWRRAPSSLLEGDPDWSQVVEAHEQYLAAKEEEAISFLLEVEDKYKLPVVVSFSGGKDSLVALHLALKAFGPDKIKVLFNNTGIEFPETVEYVRRLADKMGLDLIVADAGDAFWRGVSVMGPPARDWRWCCKVTKFAPTSQALKSLFPGGAISIVGQRKYESAQRAGSPRIWRNAWLPNVVAATPVQDWTALDIWLYIFKERLIPNPLYYYGLDRLGCWLCPASELGEFELAKRIRSDLYVKWEQVLRGFSEMKSLSDEWVKYGLWRWVNPPKDILRVIGEGAVSPRRGADIRWHVEGAQIVFTLNRPRQPLAVEKFKNVLYTSREEANKVLNVVAGDTYLRVELKEPTEKNIENLARVVVRSFYCVECLECSNWCPRGAIWLDSKNGGISIEERRCIQCGTCNTKCPIVEYTLKFIRTERRLLQQRELGSLRQ
ncbi:MAG: phosphoadenosine phosphosulfate reductase family protein [Infirmifilum sp.]